MALHDDVTKMDFFSDFSIFPTNDVKQVPGGDVSRRPKLVLLSITLVGPGANHGNRFRNFVMGVELCPPITENWLKMALLFGMTHRLLGKTIESGLGGIAVGMGQGCAPRLAFGLHSARGWGPGPQVIKFRFRTTATSVSLCVKEA